MAAVPFRARRSATQGSLMYAAVTIGDTMVSVEDDEAFSHDHAVEIFTTLTGAAITAYEAALHLGAPSPQEFG